MSALGERMREVVVPDAEAAEERSWRVTRAAFAEREAAEPAARQRSARTRWTVPRARLAAAAVALIALVALALTPPGRAVAGWVRDAIRPDRSPPARVPARPVLASLPGGGRLLVLSPGGPWIVRADGSRRLLGPYDDATWSPHGLFVAATRGDALVAIAPDGRVRWSLGRPRVSAPRWSPSGYRIAYRSGRELRVVAGDGTGDRLLARAAGPAAAAWRPATPGHVLAWPGRGGRVVVGDVDTRRTLGRSGSGEPPRRLDWSADGRRLLAVGAHGWRLLDARGRLLRSRRLPPGTTAGAAAFAPRGHAFALVRESAGAADVVLLPRERLVFRGAGRLGDLAWSPDGRWLAIGWPSADQWLFVRAAPARRVVAIDRVARQFDPGRPRARAAPRIAGWCCAR
ncbi:MAG: hypothetical protein QOJ07_3683 [Thermoleophilaceae bacterium]|nr:hypothetical protein [Thermoleophilaceae bacterium]